MLNDKSVGVVLPANDLDRAAGFYEDTLGLKETERVAGGVMLEAGMHTRIFIYEKPGGTKAEHTVAGFSVDNVEAEVQELRNKGVTFEEYDMPGVKTVNGIATMGTAKSAWFKDTEGNIISLNEMH